jgi:hypothetical protein
VDRLSRDTADVDATVLARHIGVRRVEGVRQQYRAARRPRPGGRRGGKCERSNKHEQESAHEDHL